MWVLVMKKKFKYLFFILFLLFFVNVNIVNAGDCNKYSCVKCVYPVGIFNCSFSVEATGTGTATITEKKCVSTQNIAGGSVIHNMDTITSTNFINKSENKLVCPSTLYQKITYSGGRTVKYSLTFTSQEGATKISLGSDSTNNNKPLTEVKEDEPKTERKSCSYDGKVTFHTDGKTLETELTSNYKVGSSEIKASDFVDASGKLICPSLHLTCTERGGTPICGISKTSQGGMSTTVAGTETADAETIEDQNTPKTEEGNKNGNSGTKSDKININVDVNLEAKEGCELLSPELKELLQTILDYIRIAGIALAVILQIADYIKAIFGSSDDGMAKANKRFSTRLIAIGILFLIPSILNFVLSLFNILSAADAGTCGIF